MVAKFAAVARRNRFEHHGPSPLDGGAQQVVLLPDDVAGDLPGVAVEEPEAPGPRGGEGFEEVEVELIARPSHPVDRAARHVRPPHDGSVLVDPSLQILGLTNRRHRSVEALEMDGVHQSDLTLARVASDPSNMQRTSAYRSAMERHQLQFRVSLRSLAYMMPHPDI